MLLDKTLAPWLVFDEDPVEEAFRRISANRSRVVFVVRPDGSLVGSLADGDFRRWVVEAPNPSLQEPCATIANRDCVSVPDGTPAAQVELLLSARISAIPVVDDRGRVAAIARMRSRDFSIDGREVSPTGAAFLIAEIGNNHNGSLDQALELIDEAAAAGADCAKFQLRDLSALYRSGRSGFAGEDLGAQYTLELLQEVSLSNDEMFEALDYVREVGLIPLCTPWDSPSAQLLHDYGIPAFKVASADLTNHDLVSELADMGRPMLVSTGMSTEQEIVQAVDILRSGPSPFALLHCNSAYPTPFKDINLLYMDRLAELGDCLVGYSGHERGFHIPIAAVARGARVVEKHITLDRGARGNDHKVSLEPGEFAQMVKQIRELESAMGTPHARSLTQGEQLNRLSLAKSLVAARDLPLGHEIASADLEVRSPGRGLQPNSRYRVVGTLTARAIPAGDFIYESDISEAIQPRPFHFDRPWGLPVRFHDYAELLEKSNPDFLEFHLSYRDVDMNPLAAVPEMLDMGFTVHSPDLFADDHLLDLASDNPKEWERSIADLQRVIDLTRALKQRFSRSERPVVIVSIGGASTHEPLAKSERPRLYERCAQALDKVDADGVELTAQTLPPFPWHVGGQRYWNLFVDPVETAKFCNEIGMRVTLDVSHTKLATNHSGESFAEAMEALLPVTAHMHLADAAGVDGEGLQVQDGDIDWGLLTRQITQLAPGVGFIPEIWQGHVGGGQGFWIGLDRLERLFTRENVT